jgi:hypothetical protein
MVINDMKLSKDPTTIFKSTKLHGKYRPTHAGFALSSKTFDLVTPSTFHARKKSKVSKPFYVFDQSDSFRLHKKQTSSERVLLHSLSSFKQHFPISFLPFAHIGWHWICGVVLSNEAVAIDEIAQVCELEIRESFGPNVGQHLCCHAVLRLNFTIFNFIP